MNDILLAIKYILTLMWKKPKKAFVYRSPALPEVSAGTVTRLSDQYNSFTL